MEKETEIWVELGAHKAVRVRVSTVEAGLPTPGERDIEREPTLPEFHEAVKALAAGKYTFHKPF